MSYKSGAVALIGKPNVGKSTLLNHLVGQKVSIVSNKPQTTRRRVLGIAHSAEYEIAFVDTPGIHEPHTRLGRAMVEAARASLKDVDLIVVVADASGRPGEQDRRIASLLGGEGSQVIPDETQVSGSSAKIVLCLNKMDLLKADQVQQTVEAYGELFRTDDYMLTTAREGHNLDKLLQMIVERLPEGEPHYPEDEYTDQSVRFMSAEIIREKVLRDSRQEVPHSTAVVIESWQDEPSLVRIEATIYVEKASQRGILIGKQGQFIKKVGIDARAEIGRLVDRAVHLELHVKVREDWRMNPRVLHELEYME